MHMSESAIYSEFRKPRQLLGSQEYDGHLSIHDDLIETNVKIVRSVSQQVAEHSPDAVVIVVANPIP